MRVSSGVLALFLGLSFGPVRTMTALAQAPRRLAAGASQGVLSPEFTRIEGVFELPDGRVVVVDAGDLTIRLADFNHDQVVTLGRHGSGPREYRAPSLLFPLGGDSVGILDDAAGRLVVINARGAISGFVSPRATDPAAAGIAARLGDGRGFFYAEAPALRRTANRSLVLSDSAPIVRWSIVLGKVDTVASVFRPPPPGALASSAGAIVRPGGVTALAPFDRWTVSADGRVAVVTQRPYRVIQTSATGETLIGAELAYARVPVSDSVKSAYVAELQQPTIGVEVGSDGTARPFRGRPPRTQGPADWASEVPAFRAEALVAFDHQGGLWIQRTSFGRAATVYDIIGSDGRRIGDVRYPEGYRVVGFGRNTVYVVYRDEDDIEALHRWSLPSR